MQRALQYRQPGKPRENVVPFRKREAVHHGDGRLQFGYQKPMPLLALDKEIPLVRVELEKPTNRIEV